MTRILLADDHKIIRQGLRSLLEAESDLEVVGEAHDGREAVELASKLSPDLIVMDIQMPNLNGVDATRQARLAVPNTRIVCLSASHDHRTAREMLRAGAGAYVVKESAFEELVTAIRTVLAGGQYLSKAFPVSPELSGTGADSGFNAVSGREREVLQLIAEGKSTKEVAAALHLSVKTVETHRRNLMEKLNLDSVAELTKYAIREGITSL